MDEIGDASNSTDIVDQAFEDLTKAERLRLVYEILTQPESEGGAGISSQVDKYVDSIMPLHDDEFNSVSIRKKVFFFGVTHLGYQAWFSN